MISLLRNSIFVYLFLIQELCEVSTTQYSSVQQGENVNKVSTNNSNWLSQLEGTHWLDHLSSILATPINSNSQSG